MSRKIFAAIAWAVLASIVFVTLSPIGWRPHFEAVRIERAGAFAVVGLLFGLAYPRRLWLVLSVMVGAALLLEALQHLTPDRHGRLSDAVVKIVGAFVGIGISWLCNRAYAALAPVAPKR